MAMVSQDHAEETRPTLMDVADLIQAKRDGRELTEEEVEYFLSGIVKGEIAEYQAAALLMAIYFNGLTDRELLSWVGSEARLGRSLGLSDLPGAKVGLQSTGGVGDKACFVVAPLVAAAGVSVPMLVGRRLGHTGGALEKILSIPGFRTDLGAEELKALLRATGCGVIGDTEQFAPAEWKLTALRNNTGTAEAASLIVASALFREVALGTDSFVLDVKTGSGSLTSKLTDSRKVAQTAVNVGKRLNKKVVALITDMDQPLGNAVGHAVEVMEAVETMRGGGPEDLVEVCLELAARMVCLADPQRTVESAKDQVFKLLNDGTALQRFRQMLDAHGGNPQIIDNFELLPTASADHVISSPRSGYISRISADDIGKAAKLLAGSDDLKLDPAVGIVLEHKVGDRIQAGERLCAIYYNQEERLEEACQMVEDAFHIASVPPEKRPLVYEVIQ